MNKTNADSIHANPERKAVDAQDNNPSVSALSKFNDSVWDFRVEMTNPAHTNADKMIKWAFEVRKGVRFDDPKYGSLLLACKQLTYATLRHPEGGVTYKPDTVLLRWGALRRFVVFLVNRDFPILRFKDVTKHVIDEYLKALRLPNKKGKQRSKQVLYLYFNVLKLLYVYRRRMSAPLQFDPFDGESASKVLGLTKAAAQSKTECIPDDVLHRLVNSALEYIKVSDHLIKAHAVVKRVHQEYSGSGKTTIGRQANKRLKNFIARLEVKGVSFPLDLSTIFALREQISRLRTACFILIAFVTGMRLSELLSLEAGCVEREVTDDGEFIWINSSIHKRLGTGATTGRWLCGPVAARAVEILERLTVDTRRTSGCPRLFVPVTGRGRRSWNGGAVGSSAIYDKLRHYVKWLGLKDDKGRPFNLHPHRFRRTFARYVVRSDTTNLLALKEHFKHVSLAMTDYYVGVDEELQDMLNEEADRLSFESFDKALRSDRLGGPRGKELAGQVDKAIADGRLPPEFRGEAGAHLRAEMIAEWVAAGQQIYPCGPGNVCWFREGFAMCTKGDRPVVEICNPVGCTNSVVLPEHVPHWRAIEERAEALLALEPPGEPYKQRLHTIAKIARKVREDVS